MATGKTPGPAGKKAVTTDIFTGKGLRVSKCAFPFRLLTVIVLLFSLSFSVAAAEVPCFEGSWSANHRILEQVIAQASEWTRTDCPQTLGSFPVQVSFCPFFDTGIDIVLRDGELRIVCTSSLDFSVCRFNNKNHLPVRAGNGYSVFSIKGIDEIPDYIDLSCSYLPELDMFAGGSSFGTLHTDRIDYHIEIRHGNDYNMILEYRPSGNLFFKTVSWSMVPGIPEVHIMVESPVSDIAFYDTFLNYDLSTGALTKYQQIFDIGD